MKDKRNALEWVVVGFSSILTLAVFSYLILQALRAGNEDVMPQVVVTPGAAVAASDGQFQVAVVAVNKGAAPAEAVGVEVTLEGAPSPEVVEFELQRLAREANTKVWVMFSQDPRVPGRSVKARVVHARLP